jgi:hypothetical protein
MGHFPRTGAGNKGTKSPEDPEDQIDKTTIIPGLFRHPFLVPPLRRGFF